LFLSRSLTRAELLRIPDTLDVAVEVLRSGKADLYAGNRERLLALRDTLPGYRIVDGRFYAVEHAIALPRARERGLDFANGFVDQAKKSGMVVGFIAKHGLRGVEAAPPR